VVPTAFNIERSNFKVKETNGEIIFSCESANTLRVKKLDPFLFEQREINYDQVYSKICHLLVHYLVKWCQMNKNVLANVAGMIL